MKHLKPTAPGRIIVLTVLVLALFQQVNAQTIIGRQNVDQYPTTAWNSMTYGLTYLPSDYGTNTTQRYPLIIFLHGSGEGGDGVNGLYRLLVHGLPRLIANGMNPEAVNPADGRNYKFIVVSPQAPSAAYWSYSWTQVQYILADVVNRYRVDPSRIYITGLSAGGAGTWSCILNGATAAQKFAAAIPVSAAGTNSQSEIDQLPLTGGTYGSKVWNVAGQYESWLAFAQNSTNAINNAWPAPAVPAIVSAVAGGDHNDVTWDAAYNVNWRANSQNKNIYEWMLQYTRGGSTPPPPVNQAPTANAGSAQTITLPTSSVTLSGSGSDPDGSITAYQWSQITGPANATFTNPNAAQNTASNLVQGTYTFRLKVTDNGGLTATSDVSITVNPAVVTGGGTTGVTRIEAENFTAQSGIQTEGCSEGGQNVGWQDTNDWMDYSVNITTAGTYTLNFRVATMFNTPQFQVRKADGTVLTTLNVPNTGTFQTWRTITASVTLPAGPQTLRLVTTNAAGGWNINWFEIGGATQTSSAPVVSATAPSTVAATSTTLIGTATVAAGSISAYQWTEVAGPNNATINNPNAPSTTVSNLVAGTYTFKLTATDNNGVSSSATVSLVVTGSNTTGSITSLKIEAENFTAQSGIQTEGCSEGGQNIGWQDTNDWMDYSVNLAGAATYTVNFRVASMFTGATFQLRNSSGAALATVTVPNTGSFQGWTTVSAQVALPAGQQTLRIVTTNAAGGWNINWWQIEGGSAGNPPAATTQRIEAENFSGQNGIQTEGCSEGGQNVGWQDTNDWMDYSVNIATAGTYTVSFRVATMFNGPQFQLRNAAGSTLATVSVPNTGSFQGWTTVTATVTLPAGQQTLRIHTLDAAGGWNINWFEIASSGTGARSMGTAEVVSTTTGGAALSIFPNPVADRFALQVNNQLTGTVQVQVINMNGVVEETFSIRKTTAGNLQTYLSIGTLTKGNYLLSVQMNGWKETTKLVKQ